MRKQPPGWQVLLYIISLLTIGYSMIYGGYDLFFGGLILAYVMIQLFEKHYETT